MAIRLTCPKGHRWEAVVTGRPDAAKVQLACPVCGSAPETLPPIEVAPVSDGLTEVFTLGSEEAAAAPPSGPPAPAPAPPGLSRIQIAGYEVLGELGRGGMGVVYKARHLGLKRLVALKMILSAEHAGAHDLLRFRTEAEAVASLQHPHIVQIYEVGEQDGRPFFALEFVEGGSLAQRLHGTPVPPRQAAQLTEKLAAAVHLAHQQGIVHRDLKPANVLLACGPDVPLGQCTPKITDFGLAKRLDSQVGQTRSGAIMGTPSYMAPEQAQGKKREIGPGSDVYSLGAILYEMLTGRPPFRGETPLDTLRLAASEEPVPPTRLQPKVPRDLETICLKCLEKDPRKRYASAAELAGDVGHFLGGQPILARPTAAWERGLKWARRRPAVAALLGLSVATVLLVIAGSLLYSAQQHFHGVELQAALNDAEQQRDEATRARARAEEQEQLARRRLYAAHMSLAQREWQEAHVDQVLALLRQHAAPPPEPDLRGFEWYYLRRLCRSEHLAFRGHAGSVWCLAFSPDGRLVASASSRSFQLAGEVKVWEAATGKEVCTFTGHTGRVAALAFSPDGRHVASAGKDGYNRDAVLVWDAETGEVRQKLAGPRGEFVGVAFGPGGERVVTAANVPDPQGKRTEVGEVHVWEAATGKLLLAQPGGDTKFTAMALSPDGRRLAVGGSVPTVQVWDVTAATPGEPLLTYRGHAEKVTSVAFGPDGRRVASAGQDGTVRVWDAADGKEGLVLRLRPAVVNDLAFSPDGRHLAGASDQRTVAVWDARTGDEEYTFRGHTGDVTSVAFHPKGRWLAAADRDNLVKVWDLAHGQESLTMAGRDQLVRGAAFSPDGRLLAEAGHHKAVRVYDPATGELLFSLPGHTAAALAIAFSPDGRLLASGGMDQAVRVWDVAARRELHALTGHGEDVTAVAFRPDGKVLATASADQTVRLWDVATGAPLGTLRHKGAVHGLAFRPDGRRLAAACDDHAVWLWEADGLGNGGERTVPAAVLRGHAKAVLDVAFSPDGRRLASAGEDGLVRVWDVAEGKAQLTLQGHTAEVTGVAFSPDGRRLASAGSDHTVKLWDLATGQETLTLRGHRQGVTAVAFSPDGQRLASGSKDGTLKVWYAPLKS